MSRRCACTESYQWHHLLVIIPNNVDPTCDLATMYITGGHNSASDIPKPTDEEPLIISVIAQQMRCPGAVLFQIPNAPISFPIDPVPGKERTEDAIIALTWWHYINGAQNPEWILELPMVR